MPSAPNQDLRRKCLALWPYRDISPGQSNDRCIRQHCTSAAIPATRRVAASDPLQAVASSSFRASQQWGLLPLRLGLIGSNQAAALEATLQWRRLVMIVTRASLGAVSIAATRTGEKRNALLKAGAQHVIVTQQQDLTKEVMRVTAGKGARIALDPVAGQDVEALATAMGDGGTIFLYGALAGEPTPFPLFPALAKNLVLRGYTLFSIVGKQESLDRGKRFVIDGLAAGRLKPLIARSFSLKDIVDAHRFLESNQQVGKIVVTV